MAAVTGLALWYSPLTSWLGARVWGRSARSRGRTVLALCWTGHLLFILLSWAGLDLSGAAMGISVIGIGIAGVLCLVPTYWAVSYLGFGLGMYGAIIAGLIAPLLIGKLLGPLALGGLLLGSISSGALLAVMMANSGGAGDNAKKYIEAGHYGGKGSDAHKAGVV
ncbi:MAG: sodium/proton-translocating pyrophosphatase, partial [Chloroflexi bacterium]|nr:sodium/proton-translocating pyrophosphatase [Chloroflexota bacterium]